MDVLIHVAETKHGDGAKVFFGSFPSGLSLGTS